MMLPVGLIVLIVLATLCAALGAVYAYIYFTRINPRSRRRYHPRVMGSGGLVGGGARKLVDQTNADDDTAGNTSAPTASTHIFLFRKP